MDDGLDKTLAALAAAVARPLDVSDALAAAQEKQGYLHERVLTSYRDRIAGLEGPQLLAWVLERLAGVEARLLALQAATAGPLATRPQASTDAVPPVAVEAVHEPAPEPPRAEEAEPEPAVDPAPTPAPPPSAPDPYRVVPFDTALVHSGLSDVETTPDGEPFRRLGSGRRAAVFLPEVALPIEVRLVLDPALASEPLWPTRLSVNGGAWVDASPQTLGDAVHLVARLEGGARRYVRALKLDIETGDVGAEGAQASLAVLRAEVRSLGT